MLRKLFCILACLLSVFLLPAENSAAEEQPASSQKEEIQNEFRGVWIATVGNTNWPSQKGLSAERQKEEFIKLLDSAAALNLNAVVVQVRPTCDAFYPSDLNPWSEYLTGKQGGDPGYDPLAFMIEQAHERSMEFHAWFNPFRVSTAQAPKAWAENSVVRQHPGWVFKYGSQRWLDPGIPEVRDYAFQSVMEVVDKYDIDAVHFDDYFYPYPEGGKSFPDDESYKFCGNGRDREDWRRENINDYIKKINEGIKRRKPWVKFGVSPIGVWRSQNIDPDGSDTKAEGSYDSVYADTRLWVLNGWVDYIAPQIYWEVGYSLASYDKVLDFWVKQVQANPNVHLYVGQAVYRIGTGSGAWRNPDEMIHQLELNRNSSFVKGSLFYNINSLLANPLSIRQALTARFYQAPAQIPAMPWLQAKNTGG